MLGCGLFMSRFATQCSLGSPQPDYVLGINLHKRNSRIRCTDTSLDKVVRPLLVKSSQSLQLFASMFEVMNLLVANIVNVVSATVKLQDSVEKNRYARFYMETSLSYVYNFFSIH